MDDYVDEATLPRKAARWLKEIEGFNTHDMPIVPEKTALLVIDMQYFFLDPASPSFTCGGLAILPVLQRLIREFRAARLPVIYTRHVHHPDHIDSGLMGTWWRGMCIEGTPESEVHRDLAPQPGEKVVLKHRYSAFYNTDLETILRCQGIQHLVITGIMTNMCCESTARDAYFRDYRVSFLADGTGSITEEMQQASLLNLCFGFAHVTLAENVIEQLRQTSREASPAGASAA